MKTCERCGKLFPFRVLIMGKYRNLKNRKYCLICSPFKQHNTINLTKLNIKGYKDCPKCNKLLNYDNFYKYKNNKYSSYCKSCNAKNVNERSLKIKQQLIELKGGKCVNCGYNKCTAALDFHHTEPHKKDIKKFTKCSMKSMKKEIEGCILLCSNCHRETHYYKREYSLNGKSICLKHRGFGSTPDVPTNL